MQDQTDLNAALNQYESDMHEIIKVAKETNQAPDDTFVTLVASGFALGWQSRGKVETDHSNAIVAPASRDFAVLFTAMTELREHTLDSPGIAAIYNKMNAHAQEATAERRRVVKKTLDEGYGPVAAGIILRAADTYTDEEAFEVAFSSASADKSGFFGYVMFHDDPKLTCRCPSHTTGAIMAAQVPVESIEKKIAEKFGGKHAALTAFGHWLLPFLVDVVKRNVDPGVETLGAVDMDAVQHHTQGLFSRILGRTPE